MEFCFVEGGTNAIRFALATSGVGNATYNARSMLIAGPAVYDDTVCTVGYWQTNNGIFDNLVCNTSGDGADLGVQNDLEVEGDIFTDSIKGSTDDTDITISPEGTGKVKMTDGTDTTKAVDLELSGITTGTTRTITMPDDDINLTSVDERNVGIICVDFTTDTAVGDGVGYFHIPANMNGMDLTAAHAEVITAGTTGTTDIEIYNVTQATDMLSTTLTIDSGETGSDTAATPVEIDTANDDVATNDLIRIDVDAISTTAAKGLIVTLTFE